MPEVLIRCPITHKQLATGIALDSETFSQVKLEKRLVFCPFCEKEHGWNKEDAFLRR